MLSTASISLRFGERKLFEDVSISFSPGNCYGLIGANGAGKTTFLKILSGEITPTSGAVILGPKERLAILKQDHFQYDEIDALGTVIMGHKRLYDVMVEKDKLYAQDHLSDADGIKASELETEFAELNGWEAEAEAASLLKGLGIKDELHSKKLKELTGAEKLKILLAQSLFGQPDVLLLDEPTNHLDIKAIRWLENFLYEFKNTVIVVSHDRHFLNKVCTHMVDIDFGKLTLYVGNYDFWYSSSQLALKLSQERNKKTEEKAKELEAFIARFSANASKSRQATSRQKQLEKLTLEDIKPSSRKYPFIYFKPEREAGKNILDVEDLSLTIDKKPIFKNISFTVNKGDKIALMGSSEVANTALLRIITHDIKADTGQYTWGVTTSVAYFPKDNKDYFSAQDLSLIDWLRQFSTDKSEGFIRGYLGRMLFSGEEALKKTSVLSGGEKVRCLLARMMLVNANVLILDEPTNHLDLESVTVLNNAIIQFSGTVIFTSHDQQFVQTIANRILEISPEGIAFDKDISYEEYIDLSEKN